MKAFTLLPLVCALAQAADNAAQTPIQTEAAALPAAAEGQAAHPGADLTPVLQALSPALQEELLNDRHEPTKEELQAGLHSLGDLVLNKLSADPAAPSRILCSPDGNRIVQIYDDAMGAISRHFIVYTRQANGLWKQTDSFSFFTRYAGFGDSGVDNEGVTLQYIDKELGLTIPEHVHFGSDRRIVCYRAQQEAQYRPDSVLTPLTSEVSSNNLYHVRLLLESGMVNMRQTDVYGRAAAWYARTPEMQRMLDASTPEARMDAQVRGEQEDAGYVAPFLESEEGRRFQARMQAFDTEEPAIQLQRRRIERFLMLPRPLQEAVLAETCGPDDERSLTRLFLTVLVPLDLEWGKQVMLFTEDASRIAVQSGSDHTCSRTLAVYSRQADGSWSRTTTFTMESAHANLSDFTLTWDGADITLADPDFGIGFTEHFKYTETDPVRRYRASTKAQSLNTALNEEVKLGNFPNVQRMLESGKVNPNDRDINGNTSLDYAGSAKMAELLKAYGARRGK